MFDSIKSSLGVQILLWISAFLFATALAGGFYFYQSQSQKMEASLVAKGTRLAMIGARAIEVTIESAIDNGVLSEEAFLDNFYEPIPGFVPPKYHTRYDFYLDKTILKFQDSFLRDTDILYAVAMDRNGYVPTHNTRFQKAYTGDPKKDTDGNRTKRIQNDPISINAGQNRKEVLLQRYDFYPRVEVWDVSSPVFIHGKHWGCFQIGLRGQAFENARIALLRRLFGISILFLAASISVTYLILQRLLRPLATFADLTTNLADGDVEHRIRTRRLDEIGQIAEALERLRVSLKAAMERLTRKSGHP